MNTKKETRIRLSTAITNLVISYKFAAIIYKTLIVYPNYIESMTDSELAEIILNELKDLKLKELIAEYHLKETKTMNTYTMNRKNREFFNNYVHLAHKRPLTTLACKEIEITLKQTKVETIVSKELKTTIITIIKNGIKKVSFYFFNKDFDSIYYGCTDIEIYTYNNITNELISFERR